jgi:hypothetical protein
MWFTTKKIPKEQIELRLFEFKGAVQTCNLRKIKFSLKVLTEDLGEMIKESAYFKEIIDFNDNLTVSGSRRKVLYNSFENLLNAVKLNKDLKLNTYEKIPHGFSCPANVDLNSDNFHGLWSNASLLKFHLSQLEVELRVQIFTTFILDENYNEDVLNDIKWHKTDLTADIVSGSEFAGDSPRIKQWEDFSESIMSFGKLSSEQKCKAIEKFREMLLVLPYNNFSVNNLP